MHTVASRPSGGRSSVLPQAWLPGRPVRFAAAWRRAAAAPSVLLRAQLPGQPAPFCQELPFSSPAHASARWCRVALRSRVRYAGAILVRLRLRATAWHHVAASGRRATMPLFSFPCCLFS
ncbi:hypothetical protein ABZP36_022021 [Zizania latifolia]